jgi:hypothetical protein
MNTAQKPNIHPRVFRDVDYDKLDFEAKSLFVIQRVYNHGTWADMTELVRFYGASRIRQEIIHATYFHKQVLNFVCFYFSLSPSDFTCYTQRQSQDQLWNY